jgi:ABC-type branched-subunit amino acid transport system ATPase component
MGPTPAEVQAIPTSSPPISAHEGMMAMSATDIILKLSNIESYYGPIMAIRGISLEVPRGKIVTAARRQRRRQDHGAEDHLRHHRSAEGLDRIQGQEIQRMEADKIVRLASATCRRGARCSRS